ncbi:hypothetical protein SAMN05444162_1233 [Paenibacillaceae bacterium GAS479]|nr:hypothetical protein SAMN05444162_1233 [Paenibacillaceae bacterium GAS479]
MQQPQQLRPMGIGRILDRSFQLYRTHFTTLAIIMLVLYGPMALATMGLSGDSGSAYSGMISGFQDGNFEEYFNTVDPEAQPITGLAIFSLLAGLVMMLFLGPVSVAAVLHLVQAHLRGEEVPGPGELLKRGFRRFWPLTGSTLLFGVIIFGMYLLVVIAAGIVIGLMIAVGTAGMGGTSPGMVLLIFVLLLAILLFVTFFVIRWAYYLPFVAFDESGTGLGYSWRVTKGSFWRLLLLYIVLSLLLSIFTGVISLGTTALFGGGTLNYIVSSLVSILIGALWVLPYAVSFFDLRVRRDGYGLDQLLNNADPYAGQTPPAPPASWGGYGSSERNDGTDNKEGSDGSGGSEGGNRP